MTQRVEGLDIAFVDAPTWSILIADDSGFWRRRVEEAVRGYRQLCEIHFASTGPEALAVLAEKRVDVAFVDLEMPGCGGAELIERVRGHGKMPFFAIISASSDNASMEKMHRLSAYDYLVKPFDELAIRRVLETYDRISQRTRVLIVDDSGSTRSVIRKILSDSIFWLDIDDVADGVTAFEHYTARRADIVFLDMNMPGISGVDTLRILRAYHPEVRCVLMSTDERSLEEAVEAKPAGIMRKPFNAGDLDRVMHGLFSLRLPFSAIPLEEIRFPERDQAAAPRTSERRRSA